MPIVKKCNSNSEQPSALILQNIINHLDLPRSFKDKVVNAGVEGLVGQNYIENDTDTVQDNIARYGVIYQLPRAALSRPSFLAALLLSFITLALR